MKNVFGNIITRTIGSGVSLTKIEKELLELLPINLPPNVAEIIIQQIDTFNLVQREADGRALNFYYIVKGKINRDSMPIIKTKKDETKLLAITFIIEKEPREFHATFTAISGVFFCMNFSDDLRSYKKKSKITVAKISKSWKSDLIL